MNKPLCLFYSGSRRALILPTLAILLLACATNRAEDGGLALELTGEPKTVFHKGEGGYQVFRIPALIAAADGTLLTIAEGRVDSRADDAQIRLVMKRSTDNGMTWSESSVIHADGENTVGNPSPVLDAETGIIWLFFSRNNKEVWLTSTADAGLTWREPVDVTGQIRSEQHTGSYATGPGHGIQLAVGPRKGRLLIPAYAGYLEAEGFQAGSKSLVIYSDDHGKSWQASPPTQEEVTGGPDGNECMLVEMSNGEIYMTIRNNTAKGGRAYAVSHDGGSSWSKVRCDPRLPEPVCQASVLRYSLPSRSEVALYAAPSVTAKDRKDKSARQKISLWVSEDQGKTWGAQKLLYDGKSAYSDMAVLRDGSIGVLFEADDKVDDRLLFQKVTIGAGSK